MVSDSKETSCICPTDCKKGPTDSPANEWSSALENLTGFLNASANLFDDLIQIVHNTEEQPSPEEITKTAATPAPKMTEESCICQPCKSSPSKAAADDITKAKAPTPESPCGVCPEKCTMITNATKVNTTTTEPPPPCGICKKKCKDSCLDDKTMTSTAKATPETPCGVCNKKCTDEKAMTAAAKATKETLCKVCSKKCIHVNEEATGDATIMVKSQRNAKQLLEQFTKEKAEKIAKLKESVGLAQKNLTDIQEQLRQLERLFQDYTSMNSAEGQVNPAALYKEIMKPRSVPYIKSPVPSQPQSKSGCICTSTANSPSKLMTPHNQTGKNGEKISVLSAVPLDKGFI